MLPRYTSSAGTPYGCRYRRVCRPPVVAPGSQLPKSLPALRNTPYASCTGTCPARCEPYLLYLYLYCAIQSPPRPYEFDLRDFAQDCNHILLFSLAIYSLSLAARLLPWPPFVFILYSSLLAFLVFFILLCLSFLLLS